MPCVPDRSSLPWISRGSPLGLQYGEGSMVYCGQTPNKLRRMIVRDLDANVTRRAAREKSKETYAVYALTHIKSVEYRRQSPIA